MESNSINNSNLQMRPILLQASTRVRPEHEIAVTAETATSNVGLQKFGEILQEILNNSTTNMCWQVRLQNQSNLNAEMLQPFRADFMPSDKELAEIALLTVTDGEKFIPVNREATETSPTNDEFRKFEQLLQDILNNSNTNMCWQERLQNQTNLANTTVYVSSDKELASQLAFLTGDPLTKESDSIKEFVAPAPNLSVITHKKPIEALKKILTTLNCDPYLPQLLYVLLTMKKTVSLAEHSLRDNNTILVDLKDGEFTAEDDKLNLLNLFGSNMVAIHAADEFLTFCNCRKCNLYRQGVFHILLEQFQVTHMAVLLLDVLVKTYGPILKNKTACSQFEKYLDGNRSVYWLAIGIIYNNKVKHMDYIFDRTLTENMITVLFSAILMGHNSMLLLQLLTFHVGCVLKAHADGWVEVVKSDTADIKVTSEKLLIYILDGFDELMSISECISSYLFALDKIFLNKFKLTWYGLCERLYKHHVYAKLQDKLQFAFNVLDDNGLRVKKHDLLNRYLLFTGRMQYTDWQWKFIWLELHKFNLTEGERRRRKAMLDVYNMLEAIVGDAMAMNLPESDDETDFYDFHVTDNRRKAWQNVMSYTRTKWINNYFQPPNTLVCEDKCKKCQKLLNYHQENCECLTCSIAGAPNLPAYYKEMLCNDCTTTPAAAAEGSVKATEEFLDMYARDLLLVYGREDVRKLLSWEMTAGGVRPIINSVDFYHISWAVFQQNQTQKTPFWQTSLKYKYFCRDCSLIPCQLARKILNNELPKDLALLLVNNYQPTNLSRDELRALLPNIMFYNYKMVASKGLHSIHDGVVVIYWCFILSIYASYFIEYYDETPLNLSLLRMEGNTVRICFERLEDNTEDTSFEQFLMKLKSFTQFIKKDIESEYDFTEYLESEELQNCLDEIMRTCRNINSTPSVIKTQPKAALTSTTAIGSSTKKKSVQTAPANGITEQLFSITAMKAPNGAEKVMTAKDLADHCKETHGNKKHKFKKKTLIDYGQARIHETRERLRKKLTQLSGCKGNEPTITPITSQPTAKTLTKAAHVIYGSEKRRQQQPAQQQQQQEQQPQQQPPTLKEVAAAAVGMEAKITTKVAADVLYVDDDTQITATTVKSTTNNKRLIPLRNINTLCKRIDDLSIKSEIEKKENVSTGSNSNTNIGSSIGDSSSRSSGCRGAFKCDCHLRGDSRAYSTSPESLDRHSYATFSVNAAMKDLLVTPKNVNKWINETLNFIEGTDNTKARTVDPKKAAKKAKQKQRKEEGKRITELADLRDQFHDIFYKSYREKIKLKQLKQAGDKMRDKKSIQELEVNVKKLHLAKAKVEQNILALIAIIKQTNSEFKFAYLPTREELLSNLTVEAPYSVVPEQQEQATVTAASDVKVKLINPAFIGSNLPMNNAAKYSKEPVQYAIVPTAQMIYAPPQAMHMNTNAAATETVENKYASHKSYTIDRNDCVASVDANRIVTIRRINMANGPEPQVTVTAKGATPDKDKLLYTFVNGHLVQTEQATHQQQQQQQQQQMLIMNETAQAHAAPLTKTQLKKERKRFQKQQQLLIEQQQQQQLQIEQQQQEQLEQAQKLKKSATNATQTVTVTKKNNNTISTTTTTKSKVQKQVVAQNENKINKKQQAQIAKTQQIVVANKSKTEEKQKRRIKLNNVMDTGQFDNNPYKSLHNGDSDVYSESDEETDGYDNADVEIDMKKAEKQIENKQIAKIQEKNSKKRRTNAIVNVKETTKSNIKEKNNKSTNKIGKLKEQNMQINKKVIATEPATTKKQQINSKNNTANNNNNSNKTLDVKKTTKPQNAATTTTSKKINKDENKAKLQLEQQQLQRKKYANQMEAENIMPPSTNNLSVYYDAHQQNLYHQQQQQQQQQQPQQPHNYYHQLTQQMQQLRLSNVNAYNSMPAVSTMSSNASIMDQLSRGVQVENLSLPPGITLTKVDPIKSEQLRRKSESIKKLSKPLTTELPTTSTLPMGWNHPGATIIAPPVNSYMGASSFASPECTYDNSTGIIMVESANSVAKNTNKTNKAAVSKNADNATLSTNAAAVADEKVAKAKKSRKRRNKLKSEATVATTKEQTPKMITLRNPMFHAGPAIAANPPAVLQQQQQEQQQAAASGFMPARSMLGLPIPQALPVDQPAAIIKNENGMFTIRNPALHQAVTNGLAMSGYRQFGNVNYYTPQEAVAESTRNAQKAASANNATPFTYFSKGANDTTSTNVSLTHAKNNMHNNISISCTSIDAMQPNEANEAAKTNASSQKFLSAIGSEKKNAQQQKQKKLETVTPETKSTWMPRYLNNANSSYYNGFNAFHGDSNNALFMDVSSNQDAYHMQHSCGDDSPPPTISGFTSSYLDGIPNTGVIRYDDASFLKNLIPGHNLNNEVSIHNINESNYNRNNASPVAPHVDITPVYGRSTSASLYEQSQQQQQQLQQRLNGSQEQLLHSSSTNFSDSMSSYSIDSSPFEAVNLLQTKPEASGLGLTGLFNNKSTKQNTDANHTSSSNQANHQSTSSFLYDDSNKNRHTINANGWW